MKSPEPRQLLLNWWHSRPNWRLSDSYPGEHSGEARVAMEFARRRQSNTALAEARISEMDPLTILNDCIVPLLGEDGLTVHLVRPDRACSWLISAVFDYPQGQIFSRYKARLTAIDGREPIVYGRPERPGWQMIDFDLSKSIQPQIDQAKKDLLYLQEMAERKGGTKRPEKIISKSRERLVLALRALDGKEAGESWASIGSVLAGKAIEDTQKTKARSLAELGEKMRDGGYEDLLAGTRRWE